MIIQVRGTSGSGKSTVVRKVKDALEEWTPVFKDGRKKPLYYLRPDPIEPLVVLGHYESPCGGGDTIGSARKIYELIRDLKTGILSPAAVLVEGLLLSEDVKWTTNLAEDYAVSALFLTTEIETCLQRIRGRRVAAGNPKPLSETNTANRVKTIERARGKLLEAGVYCRRAAADQAPNVILKWLGFTRAIGGINGPGTSLADRRQRFGRDLPLLHGKGTARGDGAYPGN